MTDLQDTTLEAAMRMGATRTINVAENAAAMDDYSADKGYFDICFECSAARAAIRDAITDRR